jgi:hypothetical protein
LPPLESNTGTFISWSDAIGYAVLDNCVELDIGGTIVERYYPEFWAMYDSINDTKDDQMLLKATSFLSSRHNAQFENDLMIPLKFFFTKDYKLALPIGAIDRQNIRLKFSFKKFLDCINYDGDIPDFSVDFLEANVYAEYIYIDDKILTDFETTEYSYMTDIVESQDIHINTRISNPVVPLNFKGVCKELVFGCIETKSIDNNDYFNYSNVYDTNNPSKLIDSIGMTIDGHKRFDDITEAYYRFAFVQSAHNSDNLRYIYCIPFSVIPNNYQPTGGINLAMLHTTTLDITMVKNSPDCILKIYAILYKRITIKGGVLT